MKEKLINNFLRISSIPRKSGNEEKIANFFVDIAKENNLYVYKDCNNNVLIKKKGNIKGDSIALQAHLDMVCVKKERSNHDFDKDGIDVIINGDEVRAKDTTLGADQGIGLAMMLTLIEDNTLTHPDLEFMFTTEEETTFKGAFTFQYSKLNSKKLINLDHAVDSEVIIGCDGDVINEYIFSGEKIKSNMPSYKIILDGFVGGNSGERPELSEFNAITTLAKILNNKNILLSSINGGINENDLATSCFAVICTDENIDSICNRSNIKYKKVDCDKFFNKEDSDKIIKQILDLKCGFISKNNASANLGLISTNDGQVKIGYIIKSINEKELEDINNQTKNLNNGFSVEEVYRDSVWKVNNNSELLEKYRNVYFNLYNEYPISQIAHGGLECSAIKNEMIDVDIIAIGAYISKHHTVDEVTHISSWLKIYNLLTKLLEIIND